VNITLRRITFNTTGPTYGVLLNQDIPLCLTLERPWGNNAPDLSCIPPGTYPCIPHNTPEKPNCWEVTQVPNRSAILFHAGNTVADSLGCILVGTEFFPGGIGQSQDALNYLRKTLPQNFTLNVINPEG